MGTYLHNQLFSPAICVYGFVIGGAKWVGRPSIRFLVDFFNSASIATQLVAGGYKWNHHTC